MDYDLDDWKMILAPFALLICILWDIAYYVAKDYLKVNMHSWIPSNLFVLSALTIQILSYVDIQKINVFGPSNGNDMEVLVDNQLRIDAARLTMCVFVGCLLPGIATVGTVGRWSNVAALFVSLSFHIATEIYALENVNNSIVQSEAGPWFMASGMLLLLGASSLLLLLGEVILYGKYLRDVIRPEDADVESEGYKWKMLRSEVMKSWVEARAWKNKYFIASSMFSPGAGMIVTICVAILAAKVMCRSSLLHNNGGGNPTFYVQCTFILVGWILMLCRWCKGALDCQNLITKVNFFGIVPIFLVPSAIVVNSLNPRLAYILLNPEAFSVLEFKSWNILISVSCVVPVLLLFMLVSAISLLLLFCFICWYFSDLLFSSQFVRHLRKLDKESVSVKEYTSTLDGMGIDKDAQFTFWLANKKSFDRIKGRMEKAYRKTEGCTALLSIMGNGRLDQNHCLRKEHSKKTWMRGISSVFTYIAQLEIGVNMEAAFEAYRETQDVLKFVDCPENIVVDPFNIFGTLNIKGFIRSIDCEGEMLNVERKLKQGLGPSVEEKRDRVKLVLTREGGQSVKELVLKLNALGTEMFDCQLMRVDEYSNYNMEELGEMLRTLVGRFIVSCLLEAPDLIIKYTRQWAKDLDEGKIERAVEVAGKVSGLLEKLVKEDEDIEAAA